MDPKLVRLSDSISMMTEIKAGSDYERTMKLMNEGNRLRKVTGREDIVALAALGKINAGRERASGEHSRRPHHRVAYILHTLKSPREARTLRQIYGAGFFLIGLYAPPERRKHHLMGVKGMTESEAEKLIRRDEAEPESFGQRTRETFELADVFLEEGGSEEGEIRRFVDLVFGHPYTTFPCHNCTRHIIAAGIRRVVYIEPYPKSRAMELHYDSITVDGKNESAGGEGKIPFEPFIGVGPRRYLQLFSLSLGEGTNVERKKDGIVVEWRREAAEPRKPLVPRSYLQQEQIALNLFDEKIRDAEEEHQNGAREAG